MHARFGDPSDEKGDQCLQQRTLDLRTGAAVTDYARLVTVDRSPQGAA
jgi:hypothetical protein